MRTSKKFVEQSVSSLAWTNGSRSKFSKSNSILSANLFCWSLTTQGRRSVRFLRAQVCQWDRLDKEMWSSYYSVSRLRGVVCNGGGMYSGRFIKYLRKFGLGSMRGHAEMVKGVVLFAHVCA